MLRLLLIIKRCARTLIALKTMFRDRGYFDNYTYYPEFESRRKSKFLIFFDQVKHIILYSYCNKFYFLYGFDIKRFRNQEDYVDDGVFMRLRNKLNNQKPSSPIAILRDKSLFDIIATRFSIPTPTVLGILNDDNVFMDYHNGAIVPFTEYMGNNEFDAFLKVTDGECADGIFHIICTKKHIVYQNTIYSFNGFLNILPRNSVFILQEKMPNQHPALAAIFDKAVNTIRLVTVISPLTNKPMLFSAVLRVGVGDNEVDNWAAGGLSIGIDIEDSCLRKYGFFKPGFGTKTTEHPNSKISFEGYSIPFLSEAVKEACRFHEVLKGVHSIGWDIAITEDGPCFIEGNDNWEISLMQISNHGLQKEFEQLFQQ